MRSVALQALQDRIDGLASRGMIPRAAGRLPWGTDLVTGVVHEWLGVGTGRDWAPPICLLTHAALTAHRARQARRIFWIGRRCWPYPLLLDRQRGALDASILIDTPPGPPAVWAMEVALRLPHIAVVGDGDGLDIAQTRRLQLAAQAGGSLCMLARPQADRSALSAASVRWGVERLPAPGPGPRWCITLLRDKARSTRHDGPPQIGQAQIGQVQIDQSWIVEWNDEQGCVALPAVVVGGAGRTRAQA